MATLISYCKARRSRGGGIPMHSSSILLVEDSHSWVFGAFIAHPLENSGSYYGNGEDFVFSLAPSPRMYVHW